MSIIKPVCFREGPVTKRAVYAIQALESGTADPYQQRLALKTIIDSLCATYQVTFVPGSADQTNFMEGRAFPGHRILHYLKLDPTKLKEIEDEDVNT